MHQRTNQIANQITCVIFGKNFDEKRGSSKTIVQIIRKYGSYKKDVKNIMAPWFSDYQYSTISFIQEKVELRLWANSNSAQDVSDICHGENL